ncbi:hypothetical protein GQ44DRAFT_778419 [Phaeosphaeriaceae sp. PMI808]|nr:hypothetical protein GQ44DRAFT_778419 [Phaeosphaeriaceae sp. PMI808]
MSVGVACHDAASDDRWLKPMCVCRRFFFEPLPQQFCFTPGDSAALSRHVETFRRLHLPWLTHSYLCSSPVLSILIVALRFYTRKRNKSPLKLDDWILLPALFFTIGMGVAIIVGVHGHGIRYHTPPPNSGIPRGSTSPEEAMIGKIEWISLWLQPLALGCIKISVLAFYSRIFTALAISDFGFDVIILLLPLPKIWTLRIEVQRRLLATAVFVMGAGALLGSILLMIVFIQVQQAIESKDLTVDGLILVTRFLFWSMFEAGLAIIAVCLPTLNSLFRKMDALSILRSVRSLISFNSNRSDHGGAESYTSGARVLDENMSTSY